MTPSLPPDSGLRYVFAVGCPRSGTTALTELLNAHPSVVVGMERYKHLCRRPGPYDLVPALFEPSRFLDFRPGDTNVRPEACERWRRLYEQADEKFRAGRALLIGDKVMPAVVPSLESNFPDPRYVFIFRDVEAVASSYLMRARDPADVAWPHDRDHRKALANWHEAFRFMGAQLDQRADERVFVTRYETLFSGNRRALQALFSFLGLDVPELTARRFLAMTDQWSDRAKKPLQLDDAARAFLRQGVKQEVLERFDTLAQAHVERWARNSTDPPSQGRLR